MPANRFYANCDYKIGSSLCLTDGELHHLRVQRCAVGEAVELVNGRGALATARIEAIEKELATLEVVSVDFQTASKRPLYLGIPLMRPAKLEWVIEKGTELGADAFFLFPADGSEKGSLSEHQLERLHLLMIAALKQSGRFFAPRIEVHASLASLLCCEAMLYFGDTREQALGLVKALGQRVEGISLLVTGPEKGFSSDELSLLGKRGVGVRLSPHILRAETAPLAALAIAAVV